MTRRSKRKHDGFSRANRWSLYIIGVGVWTSGVFWLICHYLLMKQGEFGPSTNPLEPWWLKLHGLFAFGSLWLLGLLWGIHITKFWASKRGRWSGGILTGLIFVLVMTGYLLYYVGEDGARSVVSVVHWVLGLTVPGLFLWHKLQRRAAKQDAGGSSAAPGHMSAPEIPSSEHFAS